jgi:hypothetical protein
MNDRVQFKTERGALHHVTRAYVRRLVVPVVGAAEGDRIARAIAHDCPLDIQHEAFSRLYGKLERTCHPNAESTIAFVEIMDVPLTFNATKVDVLEDTMVRIALALDAGLISAETADAMEHDIQLLTTRVR